MGLFKRKKQPIPITSEEVLELIIEEEPAVLVDFFTTNSAPSRQMRGMIREMAAELDGHATVTTVDVNAYPDIAKRHGVRVVPTILVFRQGKPKGRFSGVTDKRRLLRALGAEHLGKLGNVGS